jgi:Bacterial virulence protein (VirJ)
MSPALLTRALTGFTVLAMVGCGPLPPIDQPAATEEMTSTVHVQDRWLLLHLSRPRVANAPSPFFVLYVTGDGGWGGKDLDTYEQVREWGAPVAGFSAPDYLDRLSGGVETLGPDGLARDFGLILAAGAKSLGLDPVMPVVLVGVSRGADLVVIAAGDGHLAHALSGVVAVALTDEEEYVRHPRRHLPHLGHTPSDEPPLDMARPYDYLRGIPSPIALIQSTNDRYVPAARAAMQFGPESPRRRFYPIEARNHSFAGARGVMYRALRASLEWMSGLSRIATAE